MVSAISPVTPKPAAEFSTLAMTKSSDSCSMSAGTARRAISRPGLPKMSPIKRIRILRHVTGTRLPLRLDGNADLAAAPLRQTRQDHAQLALDKPGRGASGVKGPL